MVTPVMIGMLLSSERIQVWLILELAVVVAVEMVESKALGYQG